MFRSRGWNITDTYVDDGFSGTSFERPGVKQLLEDAQNGKINLIIVKDLSRFGRNYIQVGQYIDYISFHFIMYVSTLKWQCRYDKSEQHSNGYDADYECF